MLLHCLDIHQSKENRKSIHSLIFHDLADTLEIDIT